MLLKMIDAYFVGLLAYYDEELTTGLVRHESLLVRMIVD